MRTYIIRRLLLMIPSVLLVTLLIFFMTHLIPGDVIDAVQAQSSDSTLVDRETMERLLGLDQPLIVQYGQWMGVWPDRDGRFNGLFQGNLGVSLWQEKSVLELVAGKWPVTLELGFLSLVIAQLIAMPIGVYSALRQDTWGDFVARSIAIGAISIPSFWIATLVIVFPSIWWGYTPPFKLIRFLQDPIGNLGMFIIPSLVMGAAMGGLTMRMTRTMMLEVLRQDYIRTAWSKGLREKVVVMRHALKNALIPIVTIIGIQMPFLIGGTVIIENIFSLPGMGRLLLNATLRRDYPLISGLMVIFGVGMMFINLLVDMTYSYLDPRVHYK
jgi:peptide/nickel transport system permease protein